MQVLHEMIAHRGYTICNSPSSSQFALLCATSEKDTLIVYSNFGENKITSASIKECITDMGKHNINHAILIMKYGITPSVKKLVAGISNIVIEFFEELDLSYNVTKHILVPKHELASNEERECLSKHISHLPLILNTDAVCRFNFFKKGDLIKITRKNGTVCFRVVV